MPILSGIRGGGGAMLLLAAVREELGDLEGQVVGIGPIVASATAARLIERDRPERVLMIGSAGSYPGGPRIGTAIVGERYGLSWGVAAMGLGYVPRPPSAVDADPYILGALTIERHQVLTAGAVTTDLTLAERLADGWTVEHMEAFGVALACRQAGVPFAAVLGIANRVGPDAHAEWLTHREAAQDAARDVVRQLLVTGG